MERAFVFSKKKVVMVISVRNQTQHRMRFLQIREEMVYKYLGGNYYPSQKRLDPQEELSLPGDVLNSSWVRE